MLGLKTSFCLHGNCIIVACYGGEAEHLQFSVHPGNSFKVNLDHFSITGWSGTMRDADNPGVGTQLWVIYWKLKAQGEKEHEVSAGEGAVCGQGAD